MKHKFDSAYKDILMAPESQGVLAPYHVLRLLPLEYRVTSRQVRQFAASAACAAYFDRPPAIRTGTLHRIWAFHPWTGWS